VRGKLCIKKCLIQFYKFVKLRKFSPKGKPRFEFLIFEFRHEPFEIFSGILVGLGKLLGLREKSIGNPLKK
jgi:hypothetical protein